MLFHSNIFLAAFLPIVLLIYLAVEDHKQLRYGVIVLASLFFYSYWNPKHTPVIVSSVLLNYFLYRKLLKSDYPHKQRLLILWTGVAVNLGCLSYFKYLGFFASLFLHRSGDGSIFQFANTLIPIGISFYTFQQISCLVDAYRNPKMGTAYTFMEYAAYVMFFPQLIAGPIVRAPELIDQLREKLTSDKRLYYFVLGVIFFAVGFFKKTYIADNLAHTANRYFGLAETQGSVSMPEAWLGLSSYIFQIYFDFSGYSEMAVGLGFLFGLRLPMNFHAPLSATSAIDYWRRWHITLSEFLRDYLFTPLSTHISRFVYRFRVKPFLAFILCVIVPTLITFFLSGLWHGASLLFIAWGAYHGILVAINLLWRRTQIDLPARFTFPLTLFFINISFILFRSPNWKVARAIYTGLFRFRQSDFHIFNDWLEYTIKLTFNLGLARVLSPFPFEAFDEARAICFLALAALLAFWAPKLNLLWQRATPPRIFQRVAARNFVTLILCSLLPIAIVCIVNFMTVLGTHFPEIEFVYFEF